MSGGYAMIYMSFLSYLRSLNLMSNAYTYDGIDEVSSGIIFSRACDMLRLHGENLADAKSRTRLSKVDKAGLDRAKVCLCPSGYKNSCIDLIFNMVVTGHEQTNILYLDYISCHRLL